MATNRARWTVAGLVLVGLVAACGIGIRRDLGHVPTGRVGYDDLCGLQDYFDILEAKPTKGPKLVLSVGAEGRGSTTGGRDIWSFRTRLSVKRLRAVLRRNWASLPDELMHARRVRIEVEWVDRAGIKRVVTGKDATISAGASSWSLPPHPCLSELLYGAAIYRERRVTLGLPPIVSDLERATQPDAGL